MVTARADATSMQSYAKIAGILFLISMVAGGFGEFYVPTTLIVSRDATATAANIIAHDSVFRMGFATYLVEAVSFILGGADYLKAFSPDQLNTLSLLSLKFYAYGGTIFMVFYGIATGIRAYLIYRSGYLPRFLGVLMGLAGLGFILKNLTLVLAPAYASDFLLLPMMLAGLTLTMWLLVKGVDVRKWEAKVATVR